MKIERSQKYKSNLGYLKVAVQSPTNISKDRQNTYPVGTVKTTYTCRPDFKLTNLWRIHKPVELLGYVSLVALRKCWNKFRIRRARGLEYNVFWIASEEKVSVIATTLLASKWWYYKITLVPTTNLGYNQLNFLTAF